MINKKNKVTVAIPTCYGGRSLIRAVESIRNSDFIEEFEVRIVADSIPIPLEIKNKLEKLQVKLTENKTPGSQVFKVKQALSETNSDLFVFTQDDVRFEANVLKNLAEVFQENPEVTMVAARILPEPPKSLFEHIINVGLSISNEIAITWNNGDNYLSANGRCLAFKTDHLKKMNIPDRLVNTDAFLYLENKHRGGSFMVAKNAVVYNPNPKVMSEQLRQTERFLYSKEELSGHFKESIEKEYKIPFAVFAATVIKHFLKNPFLFAFYIAIRLTGDIKKKFFPRDLTPFWKINITTKNITK